MDNEPPLVRIFPPRVAVTLGGDIFSRCKIRFSLCVRAEISRHYVIASYLRRREESRRVHHAHVATLGWWHLSASETRQRRQFHRKSRGGAAAFILTLKYRKSTRRRASATAWLRADLHSHESRLCPRASANFRSIGRSRGRLRKTVRRR